MFKLILPFRIRINIGLVWKFGSLLFAILHKFITTLFVNDLTKAGL